MVHLPQTQQRRKRQRVPGSSPTPSAGNDNAGTITSLLVRPLTSVLEAVAQSKSNGAVDSATTEYVCLLVFTALVHAVEALIEHVDVNDAAASDAIDVDLLLQCVEGAPPSCSAFASTCPPLTRPMCGCLRFLRFPTRRQRQLADPLIRAATGGQGRAAAAHRRRVQAHAHAGVPWPLLAPPR